MAYFDENGRTKIRVMEEYLAVYSQLSVFSGAPERSNGGRGHVFQKGHLTIKGHLLLPTPSPFENALDFGHFKI